MILEPSRGSYSNAMMEQLGSFQLNGSSAPSVLRDGTNAVSASKMFTVARVSAGLYTVTISGGVFPERPFIRAWLDQAAAPTTACAVHAVKGSWTKVGSTWTFQVQVMTVDAPPAADDADAGDRVTFEIKGSVNSAGTDPA